jgi:hypothetical protein
VFLGGAKVVSFFEKGGAKVFFEEGGSILLF